MVEKIFIKNRDIVVPGDVLAEGMSYLPAGKAVRKDNKIIATALGLIGLKGRVIKVIPLAGRYSPRRGDAVIGKVTGLSKFGWRVNIRSPFDADLGIGDATAAYIDLARTKITSVYDIGDYMLAGISDINAQGYIKLTTKHRPYRKLGKDGIVIDVSPTKIPRIIGRQGSMIRLLKDLSNCDILVGQNGWVWIKGEVKKQMKLSNAIRLIEKESHVSGLTDKIKKTLGDK